MTNREFFIEMVKEEAPKFVSVIKALPDVNFDYKPGDKARTAHSLAWQLSVQPYYMLEVAKVGVVNWSDTKSERQSTAEMASTAEENFRILIEGLAVIADEDWEKNDSEMGSWKAKKYIMSWGFLFDAIHHRGQLTAYLRAVGAKVPSIYGGSADEPM